MKILVKNDMYNISSRIKKFDSSYRIVYDTALQKYLIYSTNLLGAIELIGWTPLSYVCTIPYNELDARCIKYLYDTSVQNLDSILSKIDEDNKYIEEQNQLKLINDSSIMMENNLRRLIK